MTTGSLEHPAWCSPVDCLVSDRRGMHLSGVVQAASARTGVLVTAQLVQWPPVAGYPDSGQVYVNVVVHEPDEGPGLPPQEYEFCLDGDHARALGWILLRLGGDQPVVPVA